METYRLGAGLDDGTGAALPVAFASPIPRKRWFGRSSAKDSAAWSSDAPSRQPSVTQKVRRFRCFLVDDSVKALHSHYSANLCVKTRLYDGVTTTL